MNSTHTLRRETFAASAATTLRVQTAEADVVVRHEPTDTAVIEVSAREEVSFEPVEIAAVDDGVTVRVPSLLADEDGRRGVAIDLGFVSLAVGNARVRGLRVEVVLPEGAGIDLATKSGDVTVTGTSGGAVLRSGSGDLVADRLTAGAQVRTGSGDVRVREASGTFVGGSGSGDLHVDRFDEGTITLRTGSGDIRVGVPRGVPVWQDVNTASGDVVSQVEPVGQPGEGEAFITVRATTASGDITLLNA